LGKVDGARNKPKSLSEVTRGAIILCFDMSVRRI
jgi:hypothetical protein